jgi:molybdopterin converting factor small subunit
MAIKVYIPSPLRDQTQGQTSVEVQGGSIKEALDDLCRQFPGLTARLFDRGEIKPFLNVYLNNEDIRYLDSLSTAVKDGDELSIIPAVAGG